MIAKIDPAEQAGDSLPSAPRMVVFADKGRKKQVSSFDFGLFFNIGRECLNSTSQRMPLTSITTRCDG